LPTSINTTNSIIAGNSATGSGPDFHGSSLFVGATSQNSIIGSNESVEAEYPAGTPNANGDFVGTPASPIDPLLNLLGDNGGPTETMLPMPLSIAIENGYPGPFNIPTDQRGGMRLFGVFPDIGAVESYTLDGVPFLDVDADFMDDRFEPLYGYVVGAADGHLDDDSDNFTNAQELSNGTDPHDSADFLQILNFSYGPGYDAITTNRIFDVTWVCIPVLSYSLECDSDLNFGSGTLLGPITPTTFIHTETITLLPGEDYIRVRRD